MPLWCADEPNSDGNIELCNAGHLAPLFGKERTVRPIDATGLPLGMFCSEEFSAERAKLNRGDCLLLFTDGVSESQNPAGAEFGVQPLVDILRNRRLTTAEEIVDACVAKNSAFRSGLPPKDDLTLMAVERID